MISSRKQAVGYAIDVCEFILAFLTSNETIKIAQSLGYE